MNSFVGEDLQYIMCVCFDVTLYKTKSSDFLVKYVVKSRYTKRKTYADSPKLKAKKEMRFERQGE